MSIKSTLKKVALGAALMTAPFARGESGSEKTEAPAGVTMSERADAHPSFNQQEVKDSMALDGYLDGLSVYDAVRDKKVDKDAFPAIGFYATQLNRQMEKAGQPAASRLELIQNTVDYLLKPLAGSDEIAFGQFSMNPKGVREAWADSGSSIDLSAGLKVTLKFPNSLKDNTKLAFVIEVPQQSLTQTVRAMSSLYDRLEQDGITGRVKDTFSRLGSMSAAEQDALTQQLMDNFNGEGADVALDAELESRMKNDLMPLVPQNYTISVVEPDGRVRDATKDDAELFYLLVRDSIMDLNNKKAIDLGELSVEKPKENEGGWSRLWGGIKKSAASLAVSVVPDSVIEGKIDAKVKEQVITSFNNAIDYRETLKAKASSLPQNVQRDDDGTIVAAAKPTVKKPLSPTVLASLGGGRRG